MARAAKANNEKLKGRLEKSEFIEAEAQESDDDEMFGFGGGKKDDGEEEDGEDLDKTLETLVDDQEMDEQTVNAQLVQEKYQ
jgi:mediator of replication checkpoint protein 1